MISLANLAMMSLWLAVIQSLVYRVLHTAQVLRLMAVENGGPTVTLYVQSLRKSLIQRQVESGSPMSNSLVSSLWASMVLKAELKSMESSQV